MHSSHVPSGKRYVLLENTLADMVETVNTSDLRLLLEMMMCASDNECRCGMKRAHITITATDGKRFHVIGRLRNKQGDFI